MTADGVCYCRLCQLCESHLLIYHLRKGEVDATSPVVWQNDVGCSTHQARVW